jgi:hypothetical protein
MNNLTNLPTYPIIVLGMHGVLKDGFGLAAKNSIGYAKVSIIDDYIE